MALIQDTNYVFCRSELCNNTVILHLSGMGGGALTQRMRAPVHM